MEIREATHEDIPEIVKVLKASLGEQDLPLSQKIWNYKHVENPFGKSLVLVAEENGEIVGVRAFMRWQWQMGEQLFSTFRAVDTATHPKHQGKGIFKKLTLQAVEEAKQEGGNFIFNTPNAKSRSGYLKMGWEQVDKIKVQFLFSNPLHWISSPKNKDYSVTKSALNEIIQKYCKNYNANLGRSGKNFTPKTADYLQWRYEENPLQKYEVYANERFYLAGYIKKRKNLRELRISECIFLDSNTTKKQVLKKIKEWSNKYKANFISISPHLDINRIFGFSGNFGPMLTLKKLNCANEHEQLLKELGNWSYSLGDLELF